MADVTDELARVFRKNGWTWNLKDRPSVVPDEDDIDAALDEAARLLYDEPVGTQLEVGRLIVKKKHRGHDVYLYMGEYL
jgi:hypothetical protein